MLGDFFKGLQRRKEFRKVTTELHPEGPRSKDFYIYGFYSNTHTSAAPIGVKPAWIDAVLKLFFPEGVTNQFRQAFQKRCIENGLFCVDLIPTISNTSFTGDEFNKYFNDYGKELQRRKMYNTEFMTNQNQNYYYNPEQYEESVRSSERGWAFKPTRQTKTAQNSKPLKY